MPTPSELDLRICSPGLSCPALFSPKLEVFILYGFPISRKSEALDGRMERQTDRRVQVATLNTALYRKGRIVKREAVRLQAE